MRLVAFAACFCLMACPSPDSEGGSDSGNQAADSGVVGATDSGSVAADAAAPVVDTGRQPPATTDSGPVTIDDAGVVIVRDDVGSLQGTSCIEAMECTMRCDADNQTCPRECLAAVDPSQRRVTLDVFTCAQENGCRELQCIMQNCGREATACDEASGGGPGPGDRDGGMGPPPEGDMACADFLDCAGACRNGDPMCMSACSRNVRPESLQLSNAVIRCMIENQCRDIACGRQHCARQMAACAADRR
jgi:hypothetical protein